MHSVAPAPVTQLGWRLSQALRQRTSPLVGPEGKSPLLDPTISEIPTSRPVGILARVVVWRDSTVVQTLHHCSHVGMASKNGFQRDAEHSLAAQHARAAGLYPGARFSSKADVRAACATLCNKSNRKVAVKKSNKVKVVVCCRVVPCTFRVVTRTATEGTAVDASGRCPEGAWVATVVVADHTCTEADIAASRSRNTPAASIDDKTLATGCNPRTQAKLVAKRA